MLCMSNVTYNSIVHIPEKYAVMLVCFMYHFCLCFCDFFRLHFGPVPTVWYISLIILCQI